MDRGRSARTGNAAHAGRGAGHGAWETAGDGAGTSRGERPLRPCRRLPAFSWYQVLRTPGSDPRLEFGA